MNRTDRLVAMVMHLQGRRVVRAEDMAAHFEVSVRTIYRDIDALGVAGKCRFGAAPGSQELNGSFVPVPRRAPAG